MSPQKNIKQKNQLLEKADTIFENLDKLEKQVQTPEQVPYPGQNISESENIKEQAEQKYINEVNVDNPEQSPYVIKSSQSGTGTTAAKSPALQEVEDILAEDLEKIYNNMDEKRKARFKAEGEKVASIIEKLITHFKCHAKRVMGIIKDWLFLIPGVNKYFIEQESKIKTQEVMHYARKYKRESQKQW